jgi:hypothetical protein
MFKLGLNPGRIPVGLRDMTYYTAGDFPAPPAQVTVPAVTPPGDGTAWGMDGNENFGDCGVAGLNHGFMADDAIANRHGTFPDAQQVVQYYMTFTGGQDTGVVLSDFLAYARTTGFYGHTVTAYAPVGVHDVPTLHFAIWAYGFTYTGIKVTQAMMSAAQAGQPWNLSDATDSPVIGGHCIPLVGYDSQYLYAVTWGAVQPIAHSAWHFMATEAWGVITGEFADGDTRGLNLPALISDLAKVNT